MLSQPYKNEHVTGVYHNTVTHLHCYSVTLLLFIAPQYMIAACIELLIYIADY